MRLCPGRPLGAGSPRDRDRLPRPHPVTAALPGCVHDWYWGRARIGDDEAAKSTLLGRRDLHRPGTESRSVDGLLRGRGAVIWCAVGGNAAAAPTYGINVASVRKRAFMLKGLMAGLGGVILMSRRVVQVVLAIRVPRRIRTRLARCPAFRRSPTRHPRYPA